MLTTTQKGSIAEMVIATEAVKAGVSVLRPIVEGGRYDLAFEISGQCACSARPATSTAT